MMCCKSGRGGQVQQTRRFGIVEENYLNINKSRARARAPALGPRRVNATAASKKKTVRVSTPIASISARELFELPA